MSGSRLEREELLEVALEIASEYGGNLTLRQLYYQCVARGHSPNHDRDYKRLGDVVGQARMRGQFPFHWLEDRGRTVHGGDFTRFDDDVDDALERAAEDLRNAPGWALGADRWYGQPRHVSVWVEKEALSGVFDGPCRALGVSWFACKGYPSLSSLYRWVRQLAGVESATEAVVLYFGDHDPDGWQIPRTAQRTVRQIARMEGVWQPIRFERMALNMDQIRAFNPPPFPAKMTSSRYAGYVAEHGTTDAWELDALRPEQLDTLIREGVAGYFDEDIYEANEATIEERRADMRERMQEPGWIHSVLEED